jgi:hypothetical protein
MKKTLLVVAVSLAFLAGCGEDKQVSNPVPPGVFAAQAAQAQTQVASAPVATTPAPVIINQAPAQSHSGDTMTGALAGAALGYALGSASNNNQPRYYDDRRYGQDRYYNRPTVVNKTVIVKQYVKETPKPAPVVATAPTQMKSVPVSASKVIPAAPSPIAPSTPKKLSLDKPSASKSSSFGGFSRRK